MDDDYPPYAFRDSSGVLNGYLVDIWKLWEERTGVRIELEATDWEKALQKMAAQQADVIDTIFRTKERENTFDFSPPYAQIPATIYTHAGIGGIVDLKTLRGFLVGVKAGDACVEKLEEAGIHSMQRYANYETLVQAAVAGQIRVFCLDEPPANYLLYRAHAEKDFHKAFELYVGEFHRAVRKGDAETLALLKKGLSAITASEQQALRDKWMGSSLNPSPNSRYLGQVLLAAALIGGLLALWGATLSRKVKQRTAQLESEHTHLRTLVQTIPDLVWLKDKDGVYLACNPMFERFFGAKEANIVGKTDYDFVDKDLADFFREHDRKAAMAGKPSSNEEWLAFTDTGYRGLFETIKTPMYDSKGELVGVLGIARDITERKRTEDALRVSEQKFAAAFRSSPDAIIISSTKDGRIVDVNEALIRGTGYRREEMIGSLAGNLNLWADATARDRFIAQLHDKGRVVEMEADSRNKSGEIRSGLMSAELIEIDGQSHILAVFRDITERRLVEKDLAAANQRLLALSARLLQVQEEERRTLARELHDEIGQSLTALKITLQSLSFRPRTKDLHIHIQIGAAVSITDTVLKQVRQMSLDLRPAQLDDLGLPAAIRWNLERQSRLAGFAAHFAADGVPADLPEPTSIACYRISQEAITNTIKHARARNIWVRIDAINDELRLEVVDDGKGFDPTLLKNSGSNMGMVSMQERASLVNGRLEIDTQLGKGCTLRAIFPLVTYSGMIPETAKLGI